eukprot:scaffold6213_cov51-Phaeocystis_antarctica.AAC.3
MILTATSAPVERMRTSLTSPNEPLPSVRTSSCSSQKAESDESTMAPGMVGSDVDDDDGAAHPSTSSAGGLGGSGILFAARRDSNEQGASCGTGGDGGHS